MEFTQCLQGKIENRRSTICFTEGEDIEIDDEIFECLPPELALDKENLLARNRRSSVRKSILSDMEFTQVIPNRLERITANKENVDMSDMDFTGIISGRKEFQQPIVMYRSMKEVTMVNTVSNETQEMDITDNSVVEKALQNNSKLNNIENEVIAEENMEEPFDETSCIGGIIQTTVEPNVQEIGGK